MSADVSDVVVVGAGQAGLGVSYYLRQAAIDHRVLEHGRIGETWRSQRWDSFRLNTPDEINALPGCRCDGTARDEFSSHRTIIDRLESYARKHRLPVSTDTPVIALHCGPAGRRYRIEAHGLTLHTDNVVIASGDQNVAKIPALNESVPAGITQLHAGDYRN